MIDYEPYMKQQLNHAWRRLREAIPPESWPAGYTYYAWDEPTKERNMSKTIHRTKGGKLVSVQRGDVEREITDAEAIEFVAGRAESAYTMAKAEEATRQRHEADFARRLIELESRPKADHGFFIGLAFLIASLAIALVAVVWDAAHKNGLV